MGNPSLRPHRNLATWMATGALLAMMACGGSAPSSSKVYAPEDMPDICQELDFNLDKAYREMCGVKTRNYMAYRNIPEHRNLLRPKGGKIIKKGNDLELRLQSTLPMPLPEEFQGKILFDEKLRRTFIKSRMDYCEFFPHESPQSVKLIKLAIPLDAGGELSVCYTVESKSNSLLGNAGYASTLAPLACVDFTKLKIASEMSVPDRGDETSVLDQADAPRQDTVSEN